MSRLAPISVKSLKTAMDTITRSVEAKLAKEILRPFGICLYGWTDGSNHFCAIFATYTLNNVTHCPLLAMSPLLEEDRLDADAHVDFIDSTLAVCGKDKADVCFLTADNCPTNGSIATKVGVLLVGCYSHEFNLAMKSYLEQHEHDLAAVHSVMLRLERIRPSGELKRYTELRPVPRNVTRWSSTFDMVKRYLALLQYQPHCPSLRDIMLTRAQNTRLKNLLGVLEQFDSEAKRIQSKDLDLAEARALFDGVHQRKWGYHIWGTRRFLQPMSEFRFRRG